MGRVNGRRRPKFIESRELEYLSQYPLLINTLQMTILIYKSVDVLKRPRNLLL
jgi:hypothetical protein